MVTRQVAWANQRWRDVPFLFHTNQNLLKRYPPPFAAFERWAYRQSSHALPVGEEAAGVLRAKGYQGPLTVFPYGIDETLYRRQPDAARRLRERTGTNEEWFVFGYLGRFVEEKGLKGLVRAFARVARTHPRVALWLVGSGPEAQPLRALATAEGLTFPRLQLLDSVPHREAPAVLSALDALVLPSLTRPFWKEQFGRVLIEALACNTPVIGSDSGEIPHLIRKLGGGLVVREGDDAALAAAMESLVRDPAVGAISGGCRADPGPRRLHQSPSSQCFLGHSERIPRGVRTSSFRGGWGRLHCHEPHRLGSWRFRRRQLRNYPWPRSSRNWRPTAL